MATRDPHPRFTNYEVDEPMFVVLPAPPDETLPGLAQARSEPTREGAFEKHWLQTLAHVLTDEVHELHGAESLLLNTLPSVAVATSNHMLRAICEIQLDQTQEHVRRLNQVFDILGLVPDGRTGMAMEGMLVGLHEIIKENRPSPARDCGLVYAAHKIKHHEVVSYCSARDFAQLLGIEAVAQLLQKTLDEESLMEARLARVADLISSQNSEFQQFS